MELTVNGEKRRFAEPLTVAGLLRALGIDPRSVAVERNLVIVARREMEEQALGDGDGIEIIRMVGGG